MNKWIVSIGASGKAGLRDICELLAALPPDLEAAVLLVLHRPWDTPSHLRDVLSKRSLLPVHIAAQGDRLRTRHVYIGEPSIHLTVLERSFALLTNDHHREHGNRTVDLLFRSVAVCGGHNTIGVILSGALDDGARGLAAIHHAGGHTMALRPTEPATGNHSSNGMPRNAITYDGPVSTIGSAQELAAAIAELVGAGAH